MTLCCFSDSEQSLGYLALLMDRARIAVGKAANEAALAQLVIDYLPDAQVLAEAIELKVDYMVSLDRNHLVGNPRPNGLPFSIGTPAMFLQWYRERLVK